MTVIKLDPKFAELVRLGLKTSTVRSGYREYPLCEAMMDCGEEGQLPVEIVEIEHLDFGHLDGLDAFDDGFESLEELQQVLLSFYPDLKPSSDVSIIRFKLLAGGEE
jgi:hypothetical protein